MRLQENMLISIMGGVTVNSGFVNSIVRMINSFIEIGKMVGSSLRRIINKKYC